MLYLIKHLRTRFLILIVLALLSTYLVLPETAVSACYECVPLTGALCVGCDPNVTEGHRTCEADQSSCSCNVSPATCSGKGPGGFEP